MNFEQIQALIENGEYGEAYEACKLILAKDDANAQAFWYMGVLYRYAENWGLAATCFKRCAEIDSRNNEAVNAWGMSLEGLGRDREARELFLRAERIRPTAVQRSNIALTYLHQNDYDKARYWADKALKIQPDLAHVRPTLGFCDLSEGKWAKGWTNFAATLGTRYRPDVDYEGLPSWEGHGDQSVLVFGDQGLGDEIMYASCIPDLLATCNHVTIETNPRLRDVFAAAFPQAQVFGTRGQDKPWLASKAAEFDAKVAIGDLPRFFRPQPASCPGTAYLAPDRRLQRMYDALHGPRQGPRVGICWSGGIPMTGAAGRRITLATFSPILRELHAGGASLHSLQYDSEQAAYELANFGLPIRNDGHAVDRSVSFAQTLAYISTMDVVLGVDTTAHHAAGAIGVPSIILVQDPAMWNFGRYQGDGLCWYDSVRLIRQDSALDGARPDDGNPNEYQRRWAKTIARTKDEILSLILPKERQIA